MRHILKLCYLMILLALIPACTPQSSPTITPKPIPTARPIIQFTTSNIQTIANSLPASISYNDDYPLYSSPKITQERDYFVISVFYGGDRMFGGRIGIQFQITIFNDVDSASAKYTSYRSSPDWAVNQLGDEGFVNDSYGIARYSNVVLVADAENIVRASIIQGLMQDIFDAFESPNILTVAGLPVLTPTTTQFSLPFGSNTETATSVPGLTSPPSNSMASESIFTQILNILRDQAWAGVAVFVTLVIWAIDRKQKQ